MRLTRVLAHHALILLVMVSFRVVAAAPVSPPKPDQKPGAGYEIMMKAVDDSAQAFVNDQRVLETSWGTFLKARISGRPGYSGWVGIDKYLVPGENKLRFVLVNANIPGGWSGHFQMRHNGIVFFDYSDGQQDASPGTKILITFTLNTRTGPPPLPREILEPDVILRAENESSFDYGVVYANVRAQYEFLVKFFGRKPTQPIVVHVGKKGGWSNGYDLWLEAERIYDTTHNYAHEMMHSFCRDYGYFPNWMFEQLADMAYCESEVYLYARKKESDFESQWIHERSAQLAALRVRYGRKFYPRFFNLIYQDMASGQYKVRTDSTEHLNEDMTRYLSRAAGQDVIPQLESMGYRRDQK